MDKEMRVYPAGEKEIVEGGQSNDLQIRSVGPDGQALGADGHGSARGENSNHALPDPGANLHNSRVIVRFDGIYGDMDGDNISFTFMSHFIGADGRDFFKSSWIGVHSLMRTGVDIANVDIVGPDYRCI